MARLLRLALCWLCLSVIAVPAVNAAETIGTTALLDTIAAAKGKVVLVNFFASFCPPCRKEIPGLIQLRSDISQEELEITGVSVDHTREEMEKFITQYNFNFPVYYGGEEVAYAFRVSGIPHNIIYDRQGRMVVNEPGYIPENILLEFLQQMLRIEQEYSIQRIDWYGVY